MMDMSYGCQATNSTKASGWTVEAFHNLGIHQIKSEIDSRTWTMDTIKTFNSLAAPRFLMKHEKIARTPLQEYITRPFPPALVFWVPGVFPAFPYPAILLIRTSAGEAGLVRTSKRPTIQDAIMITVREG